MPDRETSDFQSDINAVNRIEAVPTILEVVCRTTGMGFAAVARVTEERWIACTVRDEIDFGLKPGGELKLETTICDEIRQSGEPIIINDAVEDEVYCRHPTPAIYGFRSYISMPIFLKNGHFFGTLCAIDPRPARVNTPEVIGMFRLFAELIAFHLDALEQIATGHARLSEAHETAELREQFIAVLGHDLRTPLGAVSNGAEILRHTQLNARAAEVVTLIQSSVARMAGLIDNLMDFARGRLGGGLTLDRNADEPLEPLLRHVIAELCTGAPGKAVETQFDLDAPVDCDHARIAQLFSNLLGNALTYGKPDAPVRVTATSGDDGFELSVTNQGDPIPTAMMDYLFQPFRRGDVRPSQQGLGLGLYIASEIARAHDGTLDVISTSRGTCFTLRIPAADQQLLSRRA